jgi:uncharacterized membrane protein YccC
LLFGLRLWVAVCLALHVAFWLELDNAQWAGTSAAVVCQPSLGASLRKGSFRMIGTIVGAVAIVILTACFPQSRTGFLLSLALLSAACGLVATLLRNFSAYAVVLAGCTAAIIASDELGATGGASSVVFTLAITRAAEICIGIVCAGVVLVGTDFGGARQRLATQLAILATEIADRLGEALSVVRSDQADTRPARRDLVARVTLRRHSIDLNGNVSPKSALSSSRNEVVPHINIRSPRLQPGKFVIGETKKTFATKTARSGHGHA